MALRLSRLFTSVGYKNVCGRPIDYEMSSSINGHSYDYVRGGW
jgi:hypothetical protein